MSIVNFPSDVLWLILEKHIYDYTMDEWDQNIYKSLIGSKTDITDKCTINEIVRLRTTCRAFNDCIKRNIYTKNGFLHVIKKQYLLH